MQYSVKQETQKQDCRSSIFLFFLCLGSTLASLARQEQTKVTKFHFDAKPSFDGPTSTLFLTFVEMNG